MIAVPVKEGENIERALRRFKRKFEMRALRARQAFIKPSVARRKKMEKAIYVKQLHQAEEQ